MIEKLYYSRDGKPIEDVLDWTSSIEDRIVKQERVGLFGLFYVSTVFLGLNHNYGEGRPLIFETMVFCRFPIKSKEAFHTGLDLDMNRYATEQEAKDGHEQMKKKWSNPLMILKHLREHFTQA